MSKVRVIDVYDAQAVSDATALSCPEESRTRQEFKDESDINTIIDRFGIGENPIDLQKWVTNVDIYDAVDDFQTAMNQVNTAKAQFDALPARVRTRFNNSPAAFVDFVSDASNVEEMILLGLAEKRVERVPEPPPVVPAQSPS